MACLSIVESTTDVSNDFGLWVSCLHKLDLASQAIFLASTGHSAIAGGGSTNNGISKIVVNIVTALTTGGSDCLALSFICITPECVRV